MKSGIQALLTGDIPAELETLNIGNIPHPSTNQHSSPQIKFVKIGEDLWMRFSRSATLTSSHTKEERCWLFAVPHLRRGGKLHIAVRCYGSIHLYLPVTSSGVI
jgi:hypothetical protein